MTAKYLIVSDSDCAGFTIYDASDYTSGAQSSDITSVTLEFSLPEQDTPFTYIVTGTELVDLLDVTTGLYLTPDMFGYSGTLYDNAWDISYLASYVYSGVPGESLYTGIELFICGIECCVRRSSLGVTLEDNCENNEKVFMAQFILDRLYEAACCGNMTYITNAMEWLTDFCANCTTKTESTTVSSGCGCS